MLLKSAKSSIYYSKQPLQDARSLRADVADLGQGGAGRTVDMPRKARAKRDRVGRTVVDGGLPHGQASAPGGMTRMQPILVSQWMFHGILLARNWRETG
jgi:hypothetical protein